MRLVGLSWWLSGKEFACQCRRHGFHPWVGKIPHATKGQLRPWTTAIEPALQSQCSATRKATTIRSPHNFFWLFTHFCGYQPPNNHMFDFFSLSHFLQLKPLLFTANQTINFVFDIKLSFLFGLVIQILSQSYILIFTIDRKLP